MLVDRPGKYSILITARISKLRFNLYKRTASGDQEVRSIAGFKVSVQRFAHSEHQISTLDTIPVIDSTDDRYFGFVPPLQLGTTYSVALRHSLRVMIYKPGPVFLDCVHQTLILIRCPPSFNDR